jgi:hypothetical protein
MQICVGSPKNQIKYSQRKLLTLVNMGHQITAIVTALPIDEDQARAFDLPVFIENGYAIVGLDVAHTDYWADKLHLQDADDASEISLDCQTTHYFAKKLGITKFAIIYTDYLGGIGDQFAVVYERGRVILPTAASAINLALRLIGVTCLPGLDEFDSMNLAKYRHFDQYFEQYWV